MNNQSKKNRDLKRAMKAERDAFVAANRCCIPGCERSAQDCHEIPRGAARGGSRENGAYADRRAWLAACRVHHGVLGDYSRYPLEVQYCLKVLQDFEYYDRARLNELRGRAPDSIDEKQVLACVVEMLARTG